jgi:hypothetical protein
VYVSIEQKSSATPADCIHVDADAGPGSLYPGLFRGFGISAAVFLGKIFADMYSFHRFKMLPAEVQIDQLYLHGIGLDLACCSKGTEAVLFAYHDFYVELTVAKYTDEILSIQCFHSTRKLVPYLHQIDITEITVLLACSK